jgi:hypothetical protein
MFLEMLAGLQGVTQRFPLLVALQKSLNYKGTTRVASLLLVRKRNFKAGYKLDFNKSQEKKS